MFLAHIDEFTLGRLQFKRGFLAVHVNNFEPTLGEVFKIVPATLNFFEYRISHYVALTIPEQSLDCPQCPQAPFQSYLVYYQYL